MQQREMPAGVSVLLLRVLEASLHEAAENQL